MFLPHRKGKMLKFKELDNNQQESLIYEEIAILLEKFISSNPDEWKSLPKLILEDLSSLMHNKHPNSSHDYLPEAALRVERRVARNIYNHVKVTSENNIHTSYSEHHYNIPFSVDKFIGSIESSSIAKYT